MRNHQRKILIVDDDDNLRSMLKDKLILEGFEVLEAKNGKEGLETALKEHPDLILLDILMPVMDGLQALNALRADKWGKNAAVIVLTVLESANAVAKAMAEGGFTYIIKTDTNPEGIIAQVKTKLK